MKIVQITLWATVALVWTGCSTSEVSIPTAKETVSLENGKQYSVPVGSIYTKAPVTKKAIQRYTELGVKDCKNGDITWEEKNVSEGINSVMRNGTKEEGLAIIRKAAKEGTIGCSSPLSNS